MNYTCKLQTLPIHEIISNKLSNHLQTYLRRPGIFDKTPKFLDFSKQKTVSTDREIHVGPKKHQQYLFIIYFIVNMK